MNKSILIGNLTRDPEIKTIPSSGTSVCNFTLAVTRRFPNKQGEKEVDFIPVVVWGKQGESCAKYLRKGSKCAVVGSIQTRSYEAQDKSKRYVTEVVAEEVEFLDGKQKGEQQQAQRQSGGYDAASMHEIDEDLPF